MHLNIAALGHAERLALWMGKKEPRWGDGASQVPRRNRDEEDPVRCAAAAVAAKLLLLWKNCTQQLQVQLTTFTRATCRA